MPLNSRLATLISMATLAGIMPAATKEQADEPATNHVQSVETSYMQKTWGYSGGLLGTGIDYFGKGISLTGEGISWTFDKIMMPARKTGDVAKKIGDTLAKGPEWVEDKTGIPMETPASILRSPGSIIFSLTDNSSDLLKDLPKTSFGVMGSSLALMGSSVAVNTNNMAQSVKNLGLNGLGLGATLGGDALPIGLQAVGFMTGTAGLPYDAMARDMLAATHRTTDLITDQADLSKPVPKDIFSAAIYTYDRVTKGKVAADARGGSFFASSEPVKDTKETKLNPELLTAMKNKKVHGG